MYVFVPCSCALCSFLGGSWSEPGSDPGASPQYRGPGKVEVIKRDIDICIYCNIYTYLSF